jgi:hypothetical protein
MDENKYSGKGGGGRLTPNKKGERRGGRKRGTPNKVSKSLIDSILRAAELAGGEDGLLGYLEVIAIQEPKSFLSLLGKAFERKGSLQNVDSSELIEELSRRGALVDIEIDGRERLVIKDEYTSGPRHLLAELINPGSK